MPRNPELPQTALTETNKQTHSPGGHASFQWCFCLYSEMAAPVSVQLSTQVSFPMLPSNTTTQAEIWPASQWVPCSGLVCLKGGKAFLLGFNGTSICAMFLNLTWEQTNVAQYTETRRCNLSQQNAALERLLSSVPNHTYLYS